MGSKHEPSIYLALAASQGPRIWSEPALSIVELIFSWLAYYPGVISLILNGDACSDTQPQCCSWSPLLSTAPAFLKQRAQSTAACLPLPTYFLDEPQELELEYWILNIVLWYIVSSEAPFHTFLSQAELPILYTNHAACISSFPAHSP